MPYDPVRDSAGREGFDDASRGRSDPTPTPPAASLVGYQLSQTASGLPLPPAFHEDQAWKRSHQSVPPHPAAGSVSFSRPTSSSSSVHSGWAPAPPASFISEDRMRRGSSTIEGVGFVQPLPPGMQPSSWEDERRRSSNGSIGHGVPLPGSHPRTSMLPPSIPPPHPQSHGVSAALYRSTSRESDHSAHGGSGRPSSGYGRAGSAHSQPVGTIHGAPYAVMSSASPQMTRASPAYSARGSLPPSTHFVPSPAHTPVGSQNSYFPSHYPPPYASSGTHASPRNSISNLLTPVELTSTPARGSPLPYPGALQPFAFTPGGSSAPRYPSATPGYDNGAPSLAAFDRDSSSSRPSSSQRQSLPAASMHSPHQVPYPRPTPASISEAERPSIQGWTTGGELAVSRRDYETLTRDYEPLTRKITPTGGSLAAMMNSPHVAPEKTAEVLKTPRSTSAYNNTDIENTADTPMTRTPPSSVRKASHNDSDDAYLSPTQMRSNEDPHLKRQASEQELSAAEALSALAGTPSASRSVDYQKDTQQSSLENSSCTDIHHGEPEGNLVSALKQADMISPKTTPAVEESPKKRKRVTKAVAAAGVIESDKPDKPKPSAAGRKRKASAQDPTASTAGDDAATTTGASKVAANGKGKKRTAKDSQNDAKPSEPAHPEPMRTAYMPNRISEANTVLKPITQDELAYIRNLRNIKNPLKTGRPTKFGEANPQPSPYGGGPIPSGSNIPRGVHPDRFAMVAAADPSRDATELRAGGAPRQEIRQLGMGSSSNNQVLGERSVSGAKRARSEVEDASGGNGARMLVGRDESASQVSKRPRVDGDRGKGFEVAEHYNKRGNQGVDRRKDSRIIGLRSCNNWIKAVMIQTYVRRRPDRPWSGREPNGRVLDMGCGKGGDIAKWDNANIEEYVGIDVAEGSIEDFKTRLREMKRRLRYKADLYVLDCFRTSILELPRDKLKPGFDNVSMQFCIHYAFEKVQSVRQMLENVAMFLREGGIYFGTTVSKDKIVAALNEIPPEAEELVISNDLFRMEFTEREHDGPFGHAYNFSLKDAIDDCEEYVVDWGEFTSIAAEYKLKCIYRKDFDEMFAEHTQNPEFFHMAKRMNVIDEEGDLYMDQGQWAAVSMYLGFAFEKMPMSWNLTRELATRKEEAAVSEDVLQSQ